MACDMSVMVNGKEVCVATRSSRRFDGQPGFHIQMNVDFLFWNEISAKEVIDNPEDRMQEPGMTAMELMKVWARASKSSDWEFARGKDGKPARMHSPNVPCEPMRVLRG